LIFQILEVIEVWGEGAVEVDPILEAPVRGSLFKEGTLAEGKVSPRLWQEYWHIQRS
jgi:hypothetical protein